MNTRSKWLISTRNKLSNIAMEFYSAASLEGARLTYAQAQEFHKRITDIVNDMDKLIINKK